jgi:acyl-[acyl-carrier-protein]-phospholipid O-acyltransferase/long-chain-fatty-acid--[acyl-carrier-protein] ligase
MRNLFRIKGFIPFVMVLFLNAFVDLGHKIVIQNTVFKIYDGTTQSALIAVVNALILLPFILLFSPSGFLSNRYAKPHIMRGAAWVAIVITLLITLCYAAGWFWAAFAMTLVLAAQSAIYSPAKYGYIREIAGTENLGAANGVVQATTTIAILSGMFIFSALFEYRLSGDASAQDVSTMLKLMVPLGCLLVLHSIFELYLAYRIPVLPAHSGESDSEKVCAPESFSIRNYLTGIYLRTNLQAIRSQRVIWLSIVGLSTYWGLAQSLIAVFPTFAEDRLSQHNTVVIQALLACTGVGVMLGSILAGRVSRHHIETGLIPVGAVGIALCLGLLPSLEHSVSMAILMLCIGVAGGIFIIPLNALVQYHAPPNKMGTVLAGNNWVQNLTMLGFLAVTALSSWAGMGSAGIFIFLMVVAVLGAGYTVAQLPQSFLRLVLGVVFRGRYRIDVAGFEHIPRSGGVLLLGNHISWIDWALVQLACPRPIRFVMQRDIYQSRLIKPFAKAFGAIPIASGHSKASLAEINRHLKNGEVVCLFPEGAISRNGQLGEFKKGYLRTTDDVEGYIVPFYLAGLWGSRLSRASTHVHDNRTRGLKRNILVAFGSPIPITAKPVEVKQAVAELSIGAWQKQTDWLEPIPQACLRSLRRRLLSPAVIDSQGLTLSGLRFWIAMLVFSRYFRQKISDDAVGLLLPTTSAGIIVNMAALLAGKTVINLNYTASPEALRAALLKADLKQVITARQFISRLESKGLPVEDVFSGKQMLYLESVKAGTRMPQLVCAALSVLLPVSVVSRLYGKCRALDDPAAVLFSSGSEGVPKGVVLSHRNIVANIMQVSDVLNTQQDDIVFGSLPLFHSFGLTVTSLMPLLEGIPVVCHPDPTDVVAAAKAVARYRATVLCGTSTFLRLYARNQKVHPLMLRSLRIVVAGAEKLAPDVRDMFSRKFNVAVYEGYGATETTPVASVNIPDQLDDRYWHVQLGQKLGTVGMPLPGSAFRIVDPETLDRLPVGQDGLVLVGGTQVMLGYLGEVEKTQAVILELDGVRWYRTGDKGHLDEDGFLTIVDRYSRFAKIGGEMISLAAVEAAVGTVLGDVLLEVLAITVPDEKKGERIILLYTGGIDPDSLRKSMLASNIQALMLPAEYIQLDDLPRLGSGKTDFVAARKVAIEALAAII